MFDRLNHHLRHHIKGPLRWAHIHILLVLVAVAAIAFFAGAFTDHVATHKYDMAGFERLYGTHRVLNVKPPVTRIKLPMTELVAPPKAGSGSIFMKYATPPGNQGGVGACQCFSFARQYSYLYNVKRGTFRIFSCAFWYPVVTRGQDIGSAFAQYPPVLSALGGTLRREYDWSTNPPSFDGPYPVPQSVYATATYHRYPVRVESISEDSNIGAFGVAAIEKRISQHLMVNIGIPVYEGNGANSLFDGSGSPVDTPSASLNSLTLAGYHAMSLYKYMRNLCLTINSQRVCGFFAAFNQWGKVGWGVNCQTLQPDYMNGGCTLLSYRFVEQYAFGIEVLHLSNRLPTVAHEAKINTLGATGGPNVDHGVRAPTSLLPKLPKIAFGAYYVHDVTVADEPGDYGKLINTVARQYGLYPPLLLAVLRTECGFHTHSYVCDRYGIPPDVSFGWCQVTVQTAAQFGVGGFNVEAVRRYDNDIHNCVVMAARVLASYKSYEQRVGCDLPPPNLYVAWNAGPGQPCWFLLNPGGQAGSNFANFAVWYRIALGQASATNPYGVAKRRSRAFPVQKWGSKPYKDRRGRPLWQTTPWLTHQWLGKYRGESYHRAHRGKGFMEYRYRNGYAFCFLDSGKCKVRR